MKINIEELDLAVKYMKAMGNSVTVKITMDHDSRINLVFEDKYSISTEITLYNASNSDVGNLRPQIRKTDILTKDLLTKGTI